MIVFAKHLEKWLEDLLGGKENKKLRQNPSQTSIVFLIGARAENDSDMFVQHVALCPQPDTLHHTNNEQISLSAGELSPRAQDAGMRQANRSAANEQLDSEWLCHQARQLLRMLPGGLDVVGLMLVADKRTIGGLQPVLVKALRPLASLSARIGWMSLRPAENFMTYVSVECPMGNSTAYDVHISDSTQQTQQTRLQFQSIQWLQVVSDVSVHIPELLPIQPSLEGQNFRKQFVSVFTPIAQRICDQSICLTNGELRDKFESLTEKSKGKTDKLQKAQAAPVTIDFVLRPNTDHEPSTELCMQHAQPSCGSVQLRGTVHCVGAVPSKCSVGTAIQAIKHDLLRSLYTRAELHYESLSVVDNEQQDNVCVHQLPRRVLVADPVCANVLYSDYLFDADTVHDALESFADILNIEAEPDDVDDSVENVLHEDMLGTLGLCNAQDAAERDNTTHRHIADVLAPGELSFADKRFVAFVMAISIAILAVFLYSFIYPDSI